MRFGRYYVLSYSRKSEYGQHLWYCVCTCGNVRQVNGFSLRKGLSKSCGCYTSEINRKLKTTHGMRNSSEYSIWRSIIKRCTNVNNTHYSYYGGRGIKISEKWIDDFQCFYDDMGPRPSSNYSIDRIDVNGDYSKDNCRWSTKVEQARNKGINKRNKSGTTGVNLDRKSGKWKSEIGLNGSKVVIGFYDSKDEAIDERKKAEIKYWGAPS